MAWTVELTETAAEEFAALPPDQRAHFQRIAGLIRDHGLERIHFPLVRHIEGPLWEIRLKGRSGIARALYVTRIGERVLQGACAALLWRAGRQRVGGSSKPYVIN